MAPGTPTATRRSVPVVARFGFDHGWHCLNPTFLNLQRPVLLVDHRLLPDPVLLGLEPFGRRNPLLPLPATAIRVETHPGNMISLWTHPPGGPGELLTWHRAAAGLPAWPTCDTADTAVLIVGDTHRIQLSWAALWDGHIGTTPLRDTARPAGAPARGHGQPLWSAARSA